MCIVSIGCHTYKYVVSCHKTRFVYSNEYPVFSTYLYLRLSHALMGCHNPRTKFIINFFFYSYYFVDLRVRKLQLGFFQRAVILHQ
jgi:hypothetical protein